MDSATGGHVVSGSGAVLRVVPDPVYQRTRFDWDGAVLLAALMVSAGLVLLTGWITWKWGTA